MAESSAAVGMNILEFLAAGGVGAGLLKVFDTWVSKRKSPEDAAASLIELALKASGSSVEQLLTRLNAAETCIDELRAQHNECEQRCTTLTGQVSQQAQRIDSLLRQLKDPASREPGGALSDAIIELTDQDVTVTRRLPKSAAAPSD